MALRTNRLNAQGYASCLFAGGAERAAIRRIDLLKNMYAGEGGIDDKSGIPNGYNTGALLMPLKAGGMSSYNPAILNLVKLDADAKMGRNLEGSSALSIAVDNAQADQIVSLEVAGSLSVAVDNAGMSAGVQAAASGTLFITGSVGLGGIIPVEASSSSSVTPSAALTALGFIQIDNTPAELTAEAIANSVWNAIAAANNAAGTMGEKLNDAGGAVSPEDIAAAVWDELLASHAISGSASDIVKKIKKNADLIPGAL